MERIINAITKACLKGNTAHFTFITHRLSDRVLSIFLQPHLFDYAFLIIFVAALTVVITVVYYLVISFLLAKKGSVWLSFM